MVTDLTLLNHGWIFEASQIHDRLFTQGYWFTFGVVLAGEHGGSTLCWYLEMAEENLSSVVF